MYNMTALIPAVTGYNWYDAFQELFLGQFPYIVQNHTETYNTATGVMP